MSDTNKFESSNWRTFSIFISSTFADMQAERDQLKHIVFPKLEEELRKKRVRLEIVDLRWGVNTTTVKEDERENTVLKVCLEEIKRCRPFFIGLLGDRYGWVPPQERLAAAVDGEITISSVKLKSVTALEIEFGVLASKEQIVRSVFYFREPLPYEKFNPVKAGLFSDEFDPGLSATEKKERKAALENLKVEIRKHFEEKQLPGKVKTYSCSWDETKERITGLDAWGELVFNDILYEIERHTRDTWEQAPKDSFEQEQALLEAFVEENTHVTAFTTEKGVEEVPTFCGRGRLTDEIKEHLLSNEKDNWGLVLNGESGSGKSAVFSMIYKIMMKENCLVLAHSAGLSPKAGIVSELLRKWNRQLSRFLNMVYKEEPEVRIDQMTGVTDEVFQLENHKTGLEKLQRDFSNLLFSVAEKTRVILLIDALDQFEKTTAAQYMTWLPASPPEGVRALVTALPGSEKCVVQNHWSFSVRNIDHFTLNEAAEMLHSLCRRQHKNIPASVEKVILEKRREDGFPACISPLWLSLAVNILMAIDQDDFEKISRLEGRGEKQIETYLLNLCIDFPPSPGPLFISLIQKTYEVFGEEFSRSVFDYLAISYDGLREKDLEKLLGDKIWNSLLFANLRRWFRRHLILQGGDLRFKLAHNILRNSLIEQKDERTLKQLHRTIAGYLLTLTSDPMKAAGTMYHLVKSGNLNGAVDYYSGDLTSEEITGATASLTETISSDEKGLETVCSFPDLPGVSDDRRRVLMHRFIFVLNDALKRENLLKERSLFLEKTKNITEKLSENPDLDLEFMYDRMVLASNQGDAYEMLGNNEKALKYFSTSSELAEELCRVHPIKTVMKFSLATSNLHLGDISAAMGSGEAALNYYLVSYDQFNELFKANESNKYLLENLTIAVAKLGTIYFELGKTEEALKYIKVHKNLSFALYQINPHQENTVSLHAGSFEKLGDIYLAMGQKEDALSNFESSNTLCKKAYTLNPRGRVILENLLVSYSKLGTVCLEMGDAKKALFYFEIFRNLSEEQSKINPNNYFLEKNFSISYLKLSSAYNELGDWEKERESAHTFNNMSEILSVKYPESELIKYQLAESYEMLGNLNKKESNFNEAQALYTKSLKIKESLYEANPGSERLKGGYANVLERSGYLRLQMGNISESLFYYEKSENLYRELFLADPYKLKIKNNLALILSSLGHIHTTLGNTELALKYTLEGLQFSKELFNTDPENIRYQDDLITASVRLGELYKDMGYLNEALRTFMIANHLLKDICDKKPADTYHKDLLASSYSDIGKLYESAGYTKEALNCFSLNYEVTKELYETNPLDQELKRSYSVACSKLGSIYLSVNNKVKALELFETDMKLTEELNKGCEVGEKLKNDMAISYEQLGAIHQSLGNFKKACYYMEKDLEIMKELSIDNPHDLNILEDLGKVYNNLARIYKAMGNSSLGKERFAEWKNIISFLAKNLPQMAKYKEWDKIEY